MNPWDRLGFEEAFYMSIFFDHYNPLDLSDVLAKYIFSYDGYSDSDSKRDQSEKNQIVASMIEKSLDSKVDLYDCGTYDGKRLKDILDLIPLEKKSLINVIYGIDINENKLLEADRLFTEYDINFNPICRSIDGHLMSLLDRRAVENEYQPRKIVLGLENVFMNLTEYRNKHREGLARFLSNISTGSDVIILEAHNKIDSSSYPNSIDGFATEYLNGSGLYEMYGGSLELVQTNELRQINWTGFDKDKLFSSSEFLASNRIKKHLERKKIDIDNMSISLASSRCIPYESMFSFLMMNYANNMYIKSRDDVAYSNNDCIVRLTHSDNYDWLKSVIDNVYKQSGENFIDVPEYIIKNKLYPKFYDSFKS